MNTIYTAYVINEQGASDDAGRDTSINNLKARIRATYGAGWTVVISELDGEEVARFTLRQ
ncbi:MAG TPA: hypothetical protein VMW28_02950 [Pelolinea sp.]|nr:hypothetical protein [Pelolinea sp.]